MRRIRPIALSIALSLLATTACATQPATPSTNANAALAIEHHPEFAERLAAAGYEGTFVVLDPARERLIVADPKLAERRFIPASTFKIINSLIALETGVADSPEFTLEWDGVDRGGAAWNRDHDLRSAFEVSAVWYYQELARRIGEQRMAKWLDAADYGNADLSGGIDMFWLNGALRISPREQVQFLRRLHEGASPFSPEVVATFLEVMIHERQPDHTIRAKTGWARSQDFSDPASAGFLGHAGWFVGSVERGDGSLIYFATVLIAPDPAPESFQADRGRLTTAFLRELGYLE